MKYHHFSKISVLVAIIFIVVLATNCSSQKTPGSVTGGGSNDTSGTGGTGGPRLIKSTQVVSTLDSVKKKN